MIEGRRPRRRQLIGAAAIAAVAAVAGACMAGPPVIEPSSPDPTAEIGPTAEAAETSTPAPTVTYRIGLSDTGEVGPGWAEAMVCSAKAQATASGVVSRLIVLQRDTDAAGQLEDVRRLIADGVDAIVVHPSSTKALDPALEEAAEAGIVVVSVDGSVTAPAAFSIAVDHEAAAYVGASWLFEQLGGKGPVVYIHGDADKGVDAARDKGFRRALGEHKKIKIAADIDSKADPAVAVAKLNDLISAGTPFSGIMTSGIDSAVADALRFAGHPPVPIVGSDNGSFVRQLLAEDGPIGAVVADPPAIGAAGIELALRLLSGQVPPDGPVLVDPIMWASTDEAGAAGLAAAADPNVDPLWPLGLSIPGWTDPTTADVIACKGPGE